MIPCDKQFTRRVALLAALTATVIANIPVNGQEKRPTSNAHHEPAKDVQPSASREVAREISVHQENSQGQANGTNNRPEGYLHSLLAPETLATIGLLIVGIIGTCLALSSLKATKMAADAAKGSADAAHDSSKMLIANERAWMTFEIIEPEPLPLGDWASGGTEASIKVRLKNFGKTPAWIIEVSCRFIGNEELSTVDYEKPARVPGYPISPNAPFNITRKLYVAPPPGKITAAFGRINEQQESDIRSDDLKLRVFGFIRYRDVFSRQADEQSNVRETFFYLKYFGPMEGWVYDGPPEANRMT